MGTDGYRVPARKIILGTDEYRVRARNYFLVTIGTGYQNGKKIWYRCVPGIGEIFFVTDGYRVPAKFSITPGGNLSKAGIQMVCINPLYTAPELEYAINKVNAKILVAPKAIAALDYDKLVKVLIPDIDEQEPENLKAKNLPGLEKIIFYGDQDETPGIISWKDLKDAGDAKSQKIVDSVKLR